MGGKSTKSERRAPPVPTDTIVNREDLPERPKTLLLLGGYEHGHKPSNTIHMLVNDSWKHLDLKMPFCAVHFGAVTVNNELYIFGGGTDELYKLTGGGNKKKWLKLCDMVEKRSGITNSSLEFDGCIWVMGGTDNGALQTVEKYDPKQNRWSLAAPMHEYRSGAAAAVVNGKIFVCGGFNGFDTLDSVEFLDPASNIWTLFSSLPSPRFGLAAVSDGSCLLAIGGFNHLAEDTVWKCNTELDPPRWIPQPSLAHCRHFFTANRLRDEIVVTGGKGDGVLSRVEIFDGNYWREAANLPKAYYGHCCVLYSSENSNL